MAAIASICCADLAFAGEAAKDLVREGGWQWAVIAAGSFDLATARRLGRDPSNVLTVYIEGDGFAYATRGRRSMDPTPSDPLALRLALQHPGGGAVAWLARPCQYGARARNCRSDYWSTARYAPEVIDSASAALDHLKTDASASRLILVGYSGGGALAALLAERRRDVSALVTVAANLDLATWVKANGLTPLTGSIDPATEAAKLSRIPQLHFVGADDRVVDVRIARAFVARMAADAPVAITVVQGQDHDCCWATRWPALAATKEFSRMDGWR